MIKFERLVKSFLYAFKGLVKVFKEEQNLRIQSFFALIVIVLGVYLRIGSRDWAIIFLAIGLVILAETINSAVERVADVLKPRIDDYVKEIKDIMAAAVMVVSIVAVIVGALVFYPYLWLFCG